MRPRRSIWTCLLVMVTVLSVCPLTPVFEGVAALAQETGPTHKCCWHPIFPARLAPLRFEGVVENLNKPQQKVTIKYETSEMSFRLDKSAGLDQRKLLDTLKTGDTVEGTRMKPTGMYHFDKK